MQVEADHTGLTITDQDSTDVVGTSEHEKAQAVDAECGMCSEIHATLGELGSGATRSNGVVVYSAIFGDKATTTRHVQTMFEEVCESKLCAAPADEDNKTVCSMCHECYGCSEDSVQLDECVNERICYG